MHGRRISRRSATTSWRRGRAAVGRPPNPSLGLYKQTPGHQRRGDTHTPPGGLRYAHATGGIQIRTRRQAVDIHVRTRRQAAERKIHLAIDIHIHTPSGCYFLLQLRSSSAPVHTSRHQFAVRRRPQARLPSSLLLRQGEDQGRDVVCRRCHG